MTTNAMFLVSTFSTPVGITVVNGSDFMSAGVASRTPTQFTSRDTFTNYPMDEINASLSTVDILIPSHLASADEIDAWLMDL